MKIIVGVGIVPEILEQFRNFCQVIQIEPLKNSILSPALLEESIARHNPEVIIIEATPIDKRILQKALKLKMVICVRHNPANIDLEACRKRGIIVTNTPHRNANAVSEFTVALMLSLLRKVPEAYMRLKQGEFLSSEPYAIKRDADLQREDVIWSEPSMTSLPYFEFQGTELSGKVVGLIGCGGVGKILIQHLSSFKVKINVYDPYILDNSLPGSVSVVSCEELAATSDIITLHCKETPENIGMINNLFFETIKPGSYLINTSRGKLINRTALIHALDSGILAGAALDVFDYEPLSCDDPLLSMKNVICTPHIGGASMDVALHYSTKSLECLLAYNSSQNIPYRII